MKKNYFRKNTLVFAIPVSAALLWAAFGQFPTHVKLSKHSPPLLQQLVGQMMRMNASRAGGGFGGGLNNSLINGLRGFAGEVMGFNTHSDYVNLVCGGTDPGVGASCDGPPENGIVGTLTQFINELPAIGASAGVSSCEEVPSSGTATGVDSSGHSVALTFGAATHSIPAAWMGGGTLFAHRVTFGVTVTGIGTPEVANVAYEFNCGDSAASYAAVGMAMDNVTGFSRDIAVFGGPVDASTNGIQLFMAEHDRAHAAKIRTGHAIDIHYNPTANTFNIWGIYSVGFDFGGNGLKVINKVNGNGNYGTGDLLIFDRVVAYQSAGGDTTGSFDSAVASFAGASTEGVEADPSNTGVAIDLSGDATLAAAVFGTPTGYSREACVNLTTPNVALAPANAACSGFSLTPPPEAPAIGSGGHWTINWMMSASGMQAGLENL